MQHRESRSLRIIHRVTDLMAGLALGFVLLIILVVAIAAIAQVAGK